MFGGYVALVTSVSLLTTPRAIAARADAIVSGDHHPLELGAHQGIPSFPRAKHSRGSHKHADTTVTTEMNNTRGAGFNCRYLCFFTCIPVVQ